MRARCTLRVLVLVGLSSTLLGCDAAADAGSDAGIGLDLDDAAAPRRDGGRDGGPDGGENGGGDAGPATDAGPLDGGRDGGADCGPHGTAHFDHCHCDSGYVERERRCVAVDACRGDDPHEPDARSRDAVAWTGASMERWLCPGDRDHVTVDLQTGATLHVAAVFAVADVDIDLALWGPDTDPRFDRPILQALGRTDGEDLTYVASRTGTHLLRLFSADRGDQGSYRLDIDVRPSTDE